MVSQANLNRFLKECIRHYPESLVMKFANSTAQKMIMKFMIKEFLPVWKREVLKHMDEKGLIQLDEDVILKEIHSNLYLEKGYATTENDIFKQHDPEGHSRYVKQSIQQSMNHDQQ